MVATPKLKPCNSAARARILALPSADSSLVAIKFVFLRSLSRRRLGGGGSIRGHWRHFVLGARLRNLANQLDMTNTNISSSSDSL
jgi:hypothetical protein